MLHIYLQETPGEGLDRVYIARAGADLRLDLAGRHSAVDWLTRIGCCPGAAATLHDVAYGPVYQIAEPGDPSFVPYTDEPVIPRDRPKKTPGPSRLIGNTRPRKID